MNSDNTPTPTAVDTPTTPPVTAPLRPFAVALHDYQPTGQPGVCRRCMQPLEADVHPHRFEPTLTRPWECMCGGEEDAEQHATVPAAGGLLGFHPSISDADRAQFAVQFAEAQRTNPPAVLAPPLQITGRDDNGPKPTPLLIARPRLGARLRALVRLGGDTR